MQKKYKLLPLIKGLLLAPIPILLGLFIYALITEPSLSNNYENNSYLGFLASMIVGSYIIYIIFICPILTLMLYVVNQYHFINFGALLLTTYISTISLYIFGYFIKNNHLLYTSSELIELLIFNRSFFLTGGTAFAFWCYIKLFGSNYEKN